MKPNEATDLIAMMKGATKASAVNDDREAFWQAQLEGLDADLATEAVLDGIGGWEFFPSWAEFGKAFTAVKIRRQTATEGAERVAEYERIDSVNKLRKLPTWVKRWAVARFVVQPADMRPFPEQQDWVGPEEQRMPTDMYVAEAARITDAAALTAFRKSMAAGA